MPVPRPAPAHAGAALDRVLARGRAALGVDRVALVLREDDALLLAAGDPGAGALTGRLDVRGGTLPRSSGEVVELARRVADSLAGAAPGSAGELRDLLHDHGLARPAAPTRFARRDTSQGAGAPRQALAG